MADLSNRVNAALQDGLDILKREAEKGEAEVKALHAEVEPMFKRAMALPNDDNKVHVFESLGNAVTSALAKIANDAKKRIFGDILGASLRHGMNLLTSVLGKVFK